MQRNVLIVTRVGNGFVVDQGNRTALPSVDEFTQVAETPDALAILVHQWAITEPPAPPDAPAKRVCKECEEAPCICEAIVAQPRRTAGKGSNLQQKPRMSPED